MSQHAVIAGKRFVKTESPISQGDFVVHKHDGVWGQVEAIDGDIATVKEGSIMEGINISHLQKLEPYIQR